MLAHCALMLHAVSRGQEPGETPATDAKGTAAEERPKEQKRRYVRFDDESPELPETPEPA